VTIGTSSIIIIFPKKKRSPLDDVDIIVCVYFVFDNNLEWYTLCNLMNK